MAVDFKSCFTAIVDARDEFTPKYYPLSEFEKLRDVDQARVLKVAESHFKKTHQTKIDFYGYLFDILHEEGLSKFNGVAAASMYIVHNNALQIFPQYANLPLVQQLIIMQKACKNTWKTTRNLNGYAMSMYLTLVAEKLDHVLLLPDLGPNQRGSVDSPWRSNEGSSRKREYIKVYQNYKNLRDFDTGKITLTNYPTWSLYQPSQDYRGVKRTIMSCDLWDMLTNREFGTVH